MHWGAAWLGLSQATAQQVTAAAAACQVAPHFWATLHITHRSLWTHPCRPRALLDVAPEDLRKDVTAQEGEQQGEGKGSGEGGEDGAPARPLDQEPVSVC